MPDDYTHIDTTDTGGPVYLDNRPGQLDLAGFDDAMLRDEIRETGHDPDSGEYLPGRHPLYDREIW